MRCFEGSGSSCVVVPVLTVALVKRTDYYGAMNRIEWLCTGEATGSDHRHDEESHSAGCTVPILSLARSTVDASDSNPLSSRLLLLLYYCHGTSIRVGRNDGRQGASRVIMAIVFVRYCREQASVVQYDSA